MQDGRRRRHGDEEEGELAHRLAGFVGCLLGWYDDDVMGDLVFMEDLSHRDISEST